MPEVVGFELTGELPPGVDRDRPGAHRHADPAQARRRRQVRRVLRRRRVDDVARRPGDDRQHGARVRRDDGLLPGRRRDAALPAPHRPHRRTRSSSSSATARSRACSAPTTRPSPSFTKTLSLDLSTVEPSPGRPEAAAGPRAAGGDEEDRSRKALRAPVAERGFAPRRRGARHARRTVERQRPRQPRSAHGAVVIAAITSCTNTSNPSVMIAAGLLAKKAVEKGLTVPPHVKTSLAPGSRVVTDYLDKAGLTEPLRSSASTPSATAARPASATAARCPSRSPRRSTKATWSSPAVLSGNRNFEGRINPLREGQLPGQPAAGRRLCPGRHDRHRPDRPSRSAPATDGEPVYLQDIWPTHAEVARRSSTHACCPRCSQTQYGNVFDANDRSGTRSKSARASCTSGTPTSTYIQEPPFLVDLTAEPRPIQPIRGARVPGRARRLGDDRPHLARRLHRQDQPGRAST